MFALSKVFLIILCRKGFYMFIHMPLKAPRRQTACAEDNTMICADYHHTIGFWDRDVRHWYFWVMILERDWKHMLCLTSLSSTCRGQEQALSLSWQPKIFSEFSHKQSSCIAVQLLSVESVFILYFWFGSRIEGFQTLSRGLKIDLAYVQAWFSMRVSPDLKQTFQVSSSCQATGQN